MDPGSYQCMFGRSLVLSSWSWVDTHFLDEVKLMFNGKTRFHLPSHSRQLHQCTSVTPDRAQRLLFLILVSMITSSLPIILKNSSEKEIPRVSRIILIRLNL